MYNFRNAGIGGGLLIRHASFSSSSGFLSRDVSGTLASAIRDGIVGFRAVQGGTIEKKGEEDKEESVQHRSYFPETWLWELSFITLVLGGKKKKNVLHVLCFFASFYIGDFDFPSSTLKPICRHLPGTLL